MRASARQSLRLALIPRPRRGHHCPRRGPGRGRPSRAAAELRDGTCEARHERRALRDSLVGEQPPEHELQLLVALRQEQLLAVLILAAQRLQQRLHICINKCAHIEKFVLSPHMS